jgi:DNA (cytosine-5)-methyltransferase 1
VILDRLRAAGYTVSFELYNAANFGAPQIRERVVMIGKLGKKKVDYLSPTNAQDGGYNLPQWHTFREATATLRSSSCHCIEFPEKRLKYYRVLKEGQCWKNLPPKLQKEAMGAKLKLGGGKTGFFRRLSFDRPSPTLVTNPTMPATDLCHPTENRPLSVEEYSAVQGFPKDWQICGPILEQYKQIGNAVPVKLGEAIAHTIIADMLGKKLLQYINFSYSRYKNTSDKTWQVAMNKALKKAREKQLNISDDQMTLTF